MTRYGCANQYLNRWSNKVLDLTQIVFRCRTLANRFLFPLLGLSLLLSAAPAFAADWNVILDKGARNKCDVTQQSAMGNKILLGSNPDFKEACRLACRAYDKDSSNSGKCWDYEYNASLSCFNEHITLPNSTDCNQ